MVNRMEQDYQIYGDVSPKKRLDVLEDKLTRYRELIDKHADKIEYSQERIEFYEARIREIQLEVAFLEQKIEEIENHDSSLDIEDMFLQEYKKFNIYRENKRK